MTRAEELRAMIDSQMPDDMKNHKHLDTVVSAFVESDVVPSQIRSQKWQGILMKLVTAIPAPFSIVHRKVYEDAIRALNGKNAE
jgi:hypothetical protein